MTLTSQLPWSTANEDLVELFETVGSVTMAEVMYDGNRAKGEGIVQFTETAEAQTAGEKFTGYMYGGRPLGELRRRKLAPRLRYRCPVQPSLARLQRIRCERWTGGGGLVPPVLCTLLKECTCMK